MVDIPGGACAAMFKDDFRREEAARLKEAWEEEGLPSGGEGEPFLSPIIINHHAYPRSLRNRRVQSEERDENSLDHPLDSTQSTVQREIVDHQPNATAQTEERNVRARGHQRNHQGNCIKNAFKWIYFKWLFIVLNCVTEGFQAALSQENADGKIITRSYLTLSVVTSCFCLLISLFDMFFEMRESDVRWRWRWTRCFGWFYYRGTGRDNIPFWSPLLFVDVFCSMFQFSFNFGAWMIHKKFVEYEILPLLLSSSFFIAALVDLIHRKTMVKCEVHGRSVAECSRCRVEAAV